MDLPGDEVGGDGDDFMDAARVLDGEQGDDGLAIDAELVERLEVGLEAGSATGVGSGDGEGDGEHGTSVPGCWDHAAAILGRTHREDTSGGHIRQHLGERVGRFGFGGRVGLESCYIEIRCRVSRSREGVGGLFFVGS